MPWIRALPSCVSPDVASGLPSSLRVRVVHGLRLRGATLPQEDRQHYQHTHRQELALPVLERLEPEPGSSHIGSHGYCLAAVLQLLLTVLPRTAPGVEIEGGCEKQQPPQCKRVLIQLE